MHECTRHVMACFVNGMPSLPSVMWRDIVEVVARHSSRTGRALVQKSHVGLCLLLFRKARRVTLYYKQPYNFIPISQCLTLSNMITPVSCTLMNRPDPPGNRVAACPTVGLGIPAC